MHFHANLYWRCFHNAVCLEKKGYLGHSSNKGRMRPMSSKVPLFLMHVCGFAFSIFFLAVSWENITGSSGHPLHTFSSSHIIQSLFSNPMDHSYIAFDAHVHPFHRSSDNQNFKYLFDVDNKCFNADSKFCGLLPWQEGDHVCGLTPANGDKSEIVGLSKPLYEMNEVLYDAGYDPETQKTDLVNLLQAKGLTFSETDPEKMQGYLYPNYQHKAKDICRYESYMGTRIVVNEDSAFSLTSAHSVWVLWWTVWLIMSLSFAMSWKNAWMKYLKNHPTEYTFLPVWYNNDQWNTIIDFFALIIVLVLFVAMRFNYGNVVEHPYALLKPNGSFAYSLLALVYSWVFLRTNTVCEIIDPEDNTGSTGSDFTDPKELDSNFDQTPKLELDMSNFSNKIKADAYVQAGNGGRYPITEIPFKDDFQTLQLKDYNHVHDNMNFSHFQMTQLWTFPFLTLIFYIYDKNYATDINVTTVFVLTMLYCIIDVFSKRLFQLKEMIAKFELKHSEPDGTQKKMMWLSRPSSILVFAQIVVVLIQAIIYWYVYHFFQPPEAENKYEYLGTTFYFHFQTFLIFYYVINLVLKVSALLRAVFSNLDAYHQTPVWRPIIQRLKNHHVVEIVCLITLFLVLCISCGAMLYDTDKNLYKHTELKDCAKVNTDLRDDVTTEAKNCKLYYRWMNNYDTNSGIGTDILDLFS